MMTGTSFLCQKLTKTAISIPSIQPFLFLSWTNGYIRNTHTLALVSNESFFRIWDGISSIRTFTTTSSSSSTSRNPLNENTHTPPKSNTSATPGLKNSASSSSTATTLTTPVSITKFTDFTPWIKRFILRIHPDMIATYPVPYIERNEKSLTELFTVLENLELRCFSGNDKNNNGTNNTSVSLPSTKLNKQYLLSFYYENKQTSNTVLHECTIPVTIPSRLENMYQQYVAKGDYQGTNKGTLPVELQYHQLEWLILTLSMVQKLANAVELKVKFTLSNDLQEIYQEMQNYYQQQHNLSTDSSMIKQHNDDPFENINPQDATQQLLANLAKYSPIIQGKGANGFTPKGLDKSTAFTVKQRTRNIDRILSRTNYVQVLTNQGITKLEAAQAMARLRTLFITYHDSIGGYHSIWSKIRLTIGSSRNTKDNILTRNSSTVSSSSMTYYADVSTLSFYLPLDFDDKLTITLIEKHLPRMINLGRHHLPKHQLNKTV